MKKAGKGRLQATVAVTLCVAGVLVTTPARASGSAPQDSSDTQQTKTQKATADGSIVTEPIDTDDADPDAPVTKAKVDATASTQEHLDKAWSMLDGAMKSSKEQLRIQALTAVGTLTAYDRARKWIRAAATDNNRYVRVATVSAIGTSGDKQFIPELKVLLDDPAVEVSFAAAVVLWKMGDHSGETILYGVLDGERKTQQGMLQSELHQANMDLHNPETLAVLGAEQGGYALLGPFGIGIDAFRMMHKNGATGNSARVMAATLLGQDTSTETMQKLIDALYDRDYFVRAAAAKDLGEFHDKQVTAALLESFGDGKPTVRLMAAASYIRASEPGAKVAKRTRRHGLQQRRTAKPPAQ